MTSQEGGDEASTSESQDTSSSLEPPSPLTSNPTTTSDISLARTLLETYSHIPAIKVDSHLKTIIEKASKNPDPYPCITTFRFLQFQGRHHPLFNTVLSRLTSSNQTLLDLGCCFGQDIRYYAFRGAPASNLYGSDLHPEFLDLGYELFDDRDRMDGRFIAGDIFAAHGDSDMDKFEEKMDMISATAFLHLFSWEEQVAACCRMIQFLKPFDGNEKHRQLIFGRQTASLEPGVRVRENVEWGRKELFMHDISTFKKLWEEVRLKTGTRWDVKGRLKELPQQKVEGIVDAETARLMDFEVSRLGNGEIAL